MSQPSPTSSTDLLRWPLMSTPGLDRVGAGFGFLGATLGLVYWPLIGAGVCFLAAALALGRRIA